MLNGWLKMVSTSLISCSSFVSIYITIVTMVSQEGSCILTGIVESVVCWKYLFTYRAVPVSLRNTLNLWPTAAHVVRGQITTVAEQHLKQMGCQRCKYLPCLPYL